MKKIFVLFLISFCSFGQNKDSLLRVINSYKVKDSLQCERLNQFIELENDEKVWMKYNAIMGAISSQKLATKLSEKEKKTYFNYNGLYYNNIGFYYNSKEQYDSALYFFNKAVIQLRKSNNLNSLAQTLQNIGTIYDSKGEPTQVLIYYNQVLNIYKKTKDSLGLANIYADFGRIYIDNGSINKALDFYTKSMKISDLINDKASKFRTIRYLVITLGNQKEHQKMLEYLQELIKYYKEIGDNDSLGLIYNITASTHNDLKNYPQMFEYVDKAIKIAKKLQSPDRLAENYGLLAEYYLNHSQIDSAYKYADLEVKIRENNISEPKYTKSLMLFADILKQKREYRKAEKIGLMAYQRTKKLANPDLIMQAAKKLKEIYGNLNNTALAFNYAEIEIKMKDSVNNLNTKNSAIKALFKYETELKESQIKTLAQQKQISELESTRKTTLIYSILGGIVALAAVAYFSFTRFKARKENELLSSQLEEAEKRIKIEQKATESELKALKSQMNPHFMFNALNSIQEQFMYGDKNLANEQMGNFTYLTRQILTISGKKRISLETEKEILSKYLELEKVRFSEGFQYKISQGSTIDEDYHQIPPMLIQPFVENSIKHGLLHKKGEKTINIHFDLDATEENIICTVEDNGIGREKSTEIKNKRGNQHESFSTSATEERLKLLSNQLNAKDLIAYQDLKDDLGNPTGTLVTITIPIG